MKYIPLTKGFKAIVDDENFEELNKYNWHAMGNGRYAARRKTISPKVYKIVYMHREINKTPKGVHTDHINGNRFDNRKDNLRNCTKSENSMAYQTKRSGCSSKFIGVSWDKEKKKWESYSRINGSRKHIGYFKLEIEAAKARDIFVSKRNPEFYNLNIS